MILPQTGEASSLLRFLQLQRPHQRVPNYQTSWQQAVFSVNSQFFQGPLGQTADSVEGKPELVVDQDQQYKITLKIEGEADRTAKVYKFICPIYWNRLFYYSHLAFLAPDED